MAKNWRRHLWMAPYRDSSVSTFFHLPYLAFDKVYSLQPQKQDLSFLYNKPLNFPRLQLQCANCGDTGYNLRSGRKKTRIFLKIMIDYNHVKGNVFSKRNARTFCQNMHQDFFQMFLQISFEMQSLLLNIPKYTFKTIRNKVFKQK